MAGTQHITKEYLALIFKLFICNPDRYGLQWCRSGEVGYRAVEDGITNELIGQHLEGEKTIAVYTAPPGESKWLVFDFDEIYPGPVWRLRAVFKKAGAQTYIERSGRKGYHLWLFTPLTSNRVLRRVGKAALQVTELSGVEIFPAQNTVLEEHPGNCIKLPLGVHRATGKQCLFLNENGEPHPDQLKLLREVERADVEKLASSFDLQPEAAASPEADTSPETPAQLKPCVENLIRDGVREGYRNPAAFLIAAELRRANPRIPRETAGGVLSAFRLRCQPPLPRSEVQQVLRSAFRPDADYQYGCNWGGPPLSELVEEFCVGQRECIYLDLLKNMTEGGLQNARTSGKGGD